MFLQLDRGLPDSTVQAGCSLMETSTEDWERAVFWEGFCSYPSLIYKDKRKLFSLQVFLSRWNPKPPRSLNS